jgi:hypothetical protein
VVYQRNSGAKKEIILLNRLDGTKKNLLQYIRRFKQDYTGEHSISRFSELLEVPLHRIYSHSLLWFELLMEVDGVVSVQVDFHKRLSATMGRTWLSVDSVSYFKYLRDSVNSGFSDNAAAQFRHWMLMCYADIYNDAPKVENFSQLTSLLNELFDNINVKKEMIDYLDLRIRDHQAIEQDYSFGFETGLKLHGRYTRNQISVCMNSWTLSSRYFTQSGVMHVSSITTEAFFVTLDKTGMEYNPAIMYQDYFINGSLFHWQSQNSTSPESPKGQSYINHKQMGKRLLLFVREAINGEDDNTMAYVCCGLLEYVSHEGSKPMSITWRMDVPPPAMLLDEGQKLAIG